MVPTNLKPRFFRVCGIMHLTRALRSQISPSRWIVFAGSASATTKPTPTPSQEQSQGQGQDQSQGQAQGQAQGQSVHIEGGIGGIACDFGIAIPGGSICLPRSNRHAKIVAEAEALSNAYGPQMGLRGHLHEHPPRSGARWVPVRLRR